MKHRAIIFDLDGTLLDTLQDLTNATNHVLLAAGHEPISPALCRTLIGNGVRVLLERAIGLDGRALDQAQNQYLAYYHDHKCDHTRPFTGIPNLLDTLNTGGRRLAILSNKPHQATTEIVGHLLSDWPFEHVFGQRDGVPMKPDPAAALQISRLMGIPPQHFAFVGDSWEDVATAKAAGMFAVGVTWGLRDEPELHEHRVDAVIHEPGQLMDVLQ